MKNLLKLTVAASAVVAFSGTAALAQVDDNGDATIVIQQALTIEAQDTLDFGTVFAPPAGQPDNTVVVDPAAPGAGQQAGTFVVAGEAGETVNINLPTDTTLTRDGGAETITVDTFTSDPAGSFTLPGGPIAVGATAHIPAEQESGTYDGTYTVEVEYN